jgi:hypothetical protein
LILKEEEEDEEKRMKRTLVVDQKAKETPILPTNPHYTYPIICGNSFLRKTTEHDVSGTYRSYSPLSSIHFNNEFLFVVSSFVRHDVSF